MNPKTNEEKQRIKKKSQHTLQKSVCTSAKTAIQQKPVRIYECASTDSNEIFTLVYTSMKLSFFTLFFKEEKKVI